LREGHNRWLWSSCPFSDIPFAAVVLTHPRTCFHEAIQESFTNDARLSYCHAECT